VKIKTKRKLEVTEEGKLFLELNSHCALKMASILYYSDVPDSFISCN